MGRLIGLSAVLVVVAHLIHSTPADAGEWPQILGPARNGIADQESIVGSLPATGPKTVWQYDVGEGFAGVAVAGGRVVLFHRRGGEELVESLESQTGKPLWKRSFRATYAGGISPDNGPRCVPVVHEGLVFLFGAAGDLHCVALEDGKEIWSRAAGREFSVPDSYFGAGSTPIVDGDKLLVNVGGKSGAGIVAFAVADGKTIWQKTDEQASYSSPVAVTEDGVRQVIFVTRYSALSIDPADGTVRWRFPFGARGPTVNAASPLAFDGHLFLSASYGVGAVFAKFDRKRAETIWANNDTMSSQYATCVRHEGFLYGIDGRQDVGSARLRCFDPVAGKVRWTKDRFGMASLILADGKLIVVKDDGTMILANASPEAYQELGQSRILKGTTRALPALAGGLLYVRDTETLKCVDLRGKP
ncbi:MAG TPA: PQQ-binding-like beta-propeller repeat protein [Planctomycetaceae bacterium]|nr:PQQ-binding-like beta-propeller repeat protein [Planctomycetaceae bacterium]